ncbi:MAG: hypothetical protein ABGZ17_18545, partial [Planctomycetaceae bacterium]
MSRSVIFIAMVLMAFGCVQPPQPAMMSPAEPILVQSGSQEPVWERVIDMLHTYHFEIAREDRLDGVIETQYKTGASLQEPWHPDAVGFANRLEGTLQSIRRRVVVRLTPVDGGYLVAVEVFKELEELGGLAANSAGGATFRENTPLRRDLNMVVGQSAPSGWIALGRDRLLEHD